MGDIISIILTLPDVFKSLLRLTIPPQKDDTKQGNYIYLSLPGLSQHLCLQR